MTTNPKDICTADIRKARAILKRIEGIEEELIDLVTPGGRTNGGMDVAQSKAREAATECRSRLISFIDHSNSNIHYLEYVEQEDAKKKVKAA